MLFETPFLYLDLQNSMLFMFPDGPFWVSIYKVVFKALFILFKTFL